MIKDMVFDGGGNLQTLLLVSPKDFSKAKLEEVFIRPLAKMGVEPNTILAVCLRMPKGKVTATQAREFLEKLRPAIEHLAISQIVIAQGQYFKVMAKVSKVTNCHGRPFEGLWEDIPVYYTPSAAQFYFDPKVETQINLTLNAVARGRDGLESLLEKKDISENVEVLTSFMDIDALMRKAIDAPRVFLDIETTGLTFGSQVLSLGVGFSKEIAYAFMIHNDTDIIDSVYNFFTHRKGETIYHNCSFDTKQLIYYLFMTDYSDYDGMLEGLHALHRNIGDTQILAYLALNNTAKAELGLKNLSYEFTGDYIEGIKYEDFAKMADPVENEAFDLDKLLVYNGVDILATAYVHDKYRTQVYEEQESVYQDLFMPSQKVITQMEMTGLPLNFANVLKAQHDLIAVQQDAVLRITQHPETQKALARIRYLEAEKANAKLKKLRKTADDFLHMEFNPRSGNHLRILLYEILGLEIKKTTAGGLASTGSPALKQMKDYLNHNNDSRVELVEAIIDLQEVAIINSTFIKAFVDKSIWKQDGWRYLLGSFNLGGTVSGRLSSSNPNLQNIPSTGTKYAKIIKQCVQAPPGWIIVGADYFSLEDRISALQTKDPNKLAVYLDGYDGHCLRAYSYFKDQMPDITQELEMDVSRTVEIINSIEHSHKDLRQKSKGPTFALTYQGTWKTLVENFGLSKKEAQQIETEYHKLYKVSDDWVNSQMKLAQERGYVELAFGLRLRTPSLPRCLDIDNRKNLPYEAYSEFKTAANALGQSYGLLNNYSANMFMQKVWDSEYVTQILPIAQIHDSQYYMIRNTYGCLKFVNDHLVEAMEWCELPAIKHPEVGLGSSLEIFWPTWADPIELPNGATTDQLFNTVQQALKERAT